MKNMMCMCAATLCFYAIRRVDFAVGKLICCQFKPHWQYCNLLPSSIVIRICVVTFRVSCRRREIYFGHARLCVCLSICLSVRGRMPALLHGPRCNFGSGRDAPPPIVHYCADLQPVHGFRRYGNITRTRNVSEYTLVLALWCIVSVVELLSKFYISIFSLCDFSFRSSSACMCLPCAAKFNAIKLVSIPVLPNNIVVSFTPLYRYKPITCTWCRLYLTAYVAAVDFIFFKMADAAILHIYNF